MHIPGSGDGAALSDPSSGFITPGNQSVEVLVPFRPPVSTGRQVMSSSPYSESPTSFHTADQPDNDYQQDINSEAGLYMGVANKQFLKMQVQATTCCTCTC